MSEHSDTPNEPKDLNEEVGKLQDLIDSMQVSKCPLKTSPKIGKIAEAVAKAQAEITAATMDSQNPHFRSKYASLAAVIEAAKPLSKNGIAVFQATETSEFPGKGWTIAVSTRLVHSSGEWVATVVTFSTANLRAHDIGAAITYGRRYGLSSLAGIAQEDDDAESAMGDDDRPPPRGGRRGSNPPRRDPPRRDPPKNPGPDETKGAKPAGEKPKKGPDKKTRTNLRERFVKAREKLVEQMGEDEADHQIAAIKTQYPGKYDMQLDKIEGLIT